MSADVRSYLEQQEADTKTVVVDPSSAQKVAPLKDLEVVPTVKGEAAEGKKLIDDKLRDWFVNDAGKSPQPT